MKFINKYFSSIILMVIFLSFNTYKINKSNNELFDAYIDSRTLINKQTEYINELTTFIKNINDGFKSK